MNWSRWYLIPYNIIFILLFVLVFAIFYPFVLILIAINSKWSHNAIHRINMVWGIILNIFLMSPIWVKGRKNLPPGPCIIASNHSSYWDIGVCNLAIHRQFRFMGKAELAKAPFFGIMFRTVHIPVNRENRIDAAKSLIHAKEKLDDGLAVLIYVEGTIPDKKNVILGRFKDGAFRLAIEKGVPIVPMSIINTERVLPDEKILLMRPMLGVNIVFDAPIDTSAMTQEDLPALKEKVFDIIYKNLTANKK